MTSPRAATASKCISEFAPSDQIRGVDKLPRERIWPEHPWKISLSLISSTFFVWPQFVSKQSLFCVYRAIWPFPVFTKRMNDRMTLETMAGYSTLPR
jgi:hypothetical protein